MVKKIDNEGVASKVQDPEKASVVSKLINEHNKSSNITREVRVYKFPQRLFEEWDKDCKDRFNDCRWLKMMHDHNLSKIIPILNTVMSEVDELKSQIQDLKAQPEENEDGVQTFGGLRK